MYSASIWPWSAVIIISVSLVSILFTISSMRVSILDNSDDTSSLYGLYLCLHVSTFDIYK